MDRGWRGLALPFAKLLQQGAHVFWERRFEMVGGGDGWGGRRARRGGRGVGVGKAEGL